MERAGSTLVARSIDEHALTCVGWPFDLFDHRQHRQLVEVGNEGVTTRWPGVGSNPACPDEWLHRLREEARRGADVLGKCRPLHRRSAMRRTCTEADERTYREVALARHFESHARRLYDAAAPVDLAERHLVRRGPGGKVYRTSRAAATSRNRTMPTISSVAWRCGWTGLSPSSGRVTMDRSSGLGLGPRSRVVRLGRVARCTRRR